MSDQRTNSAAWTDAREVATRCSGRLGSRVTAFAATTCVLAIWLLNRGYNGLSHDARIYIGRAVANLDPQGLGREALFVFDGQTQLTAYTLLATPLVHWIGPSAACMGLSLATLLIWLVAAAQLARNLMPASLILAALVCAAILPAVYGPFEIFSYGEALATPRGLAEASVMAALAFLLDGRRLLCLAALLFATLMHAPTAGAGVGVSFLLLAMEAPALWLLAAVAGLAVATAGALHLGPAKTLFQVYDPAWLAVMHVRNPFLFESAWPQSAWSHAAVSFATLVIAASLARGRVRALIWASLGVASLAVVVADVFGELTSSILVLQLQPWRALWLTKVLAVLLLPFCASKLWAAERRSSLLVLALLACAWCAIDSLPLSLPLGLTAVMVLASSRADTLDRVPTSLIAGIALSAIVFAAFAGVAGVVVSVELVRAAREAGAPPPWQVAFSLVGHLPLVAAAAIAFSVGPALAGRIVRSIALMVLAAALLPVAVLTWDRRDPIRTMADGAQGRDQLNRLIGAAPNGVLWLGDDVAPWYWIGRPTWVNDLQGTVGAFSRPLALQWDRRSRLLVATGLGSQRSRDPWASGADAAGPGQVGAAAGLVALCRAPDPPSAIVAPGDLTRYFEAGSAALWRMPSDRAFHIGIRAGRLYFYKAVGYTIIRCEPNPRLALVDPRDRLELSSRYIVQHLAF